MLYLLIILVLGTLDLHWLARRAVADPTGEESRHRTGRRSRFPAAIRPQGQPPLTGTALVRDAQVGLVPRKPFGDNGGQLGERFAGRPPQLIERDLGALVEMRVVRHQPHRAAAPREVIDHLVHVDLAGPRAHPVDDRDRVADQRFVAVRVQPVQRRRGAARAVDGRQNATTIRTSAFSSTDDIAECSSPGPQSVITRP